MFKAIKVISNHGLFNLCILDFGKANTKVKHIFIIFVGREGQVHYKLYWYPKF